MIDPTLSPDERRLRGTVEDIAQRVIAQEAEQIDREARWPGDAMRALGQAGLLGLHVPRQLGGLGQGLLSLALVCETIARACSSTAMCFGMHCVATKVLAVKATPDQENRFLLPIAAGRHITTLALSEPGTGVHFYLPRATFRPDGNGFLLDGTKSFVTSGACADSYVISAVPPGQEMDPGTFTCLVLEADAGNIEWLAPWQGLGMRGNSSRGMRMSSARVAAANLLGQEGDQIWYVFEVIAPYFLVAMAGTYLGIAQAALDVATDHLRDRRYSHTGEALAEMPLLQHQLADMWIRVERSRQLVYHAARLGDAGDPQAPQALFASKADIADTAVGVTNDAMTLTGGRAYEANSTLARLLRDARAAHVMSPTTGLLRGWLGRMLLGLPPL
jgi:alkylation response protein AidB-like acyl-CoA dehydrogenase